MGITLTIDGVDRRANVLHESLRITKDDEVEKCSFTTRDPLLTEAAYRPAFGDVVRVHQDGALLFGGTVEDVDDAAADDLNAGSTRVKVKAVGYHILPSQVTVRKTYAAGLTALEVYADLFSALPSVTYIGAASGGTVMPALAFDRCYLDAALNQVKRISGYPWRINGDLQAWAGAPGSDAGSAFTFANATVLRPFGWSRQRTQYATRVWVKTGNTGATARTQTWTGDGARTKFFVDVEPTVTPNHVWEGSTRVDVPSASWSWDASRLCLTRSTPLGSGVVLTATYTVEYPAWCRAQNESAVESGDLAELIYTYPDVLELDQGVALAGGHLAQQAITPKTVRLSTRVVNPYPLQKCALSFPTRLIDGDYLIRSVGIQPFGNDWAEAGALLYSLSLIEGTALNANWLDFWRDKLAATSAPGAAASSAGGGLVIYNVTGQAAPVTIGGGEDLRTTVATASTWVRGHNAGEVIFDSSKMPATVTLDLLLIADPLTGGNAQARVVAGSGDWTNQTVVSGTVTPVTDGANWVYQAVTITLRSGIYAYRLEMTSDVNASSPGFRGYLRW